MDYQQIYQSEIFRLSHCQVNENALINFLRSQLRLMNFVPVDNREFIWQKQNCRVLICLVDDPENLNLESDPDFMGSLTCNDILITDSWISRPIKARVLRLPDSWFGNYGYETEVDYIIPDYNMGLAINRIDYNRMILFLEFHKKGLLDSNAAFNFNCARHTDTVDTRDHAQLWQHNWDNVDSFLQDRYRSSFDQLGHRVPIKNHDLDIDVMHMVCKLNVICETYHGDHSVCLSEKTFRALMTPRPWRLFAGPWSVERLESLGFDCMRSLVTHDTDGVKMIEDKIQKFVSSVAHDVAGLGDWTSDHDAACVQAHQHNLAVIQNLRQRWPGEFAVWWADCVRLLG